MIRNPSQRIHLATTLLDRSLDKKTLIPLERDGMVQHALLLVDVYFAKLGHLRTINRSGDRYVRRYLQTQRTIGEAIGAASGTDHVTTRCSTALISKIASLNAMALKHVIKPPSTALSTAAVW